jgi:hypothetical protein
MKKVITISLLSLLLMATTCRKGLTYRNLSSNNLDLILMVEKGGCYESISYSKNTVINSTNYFPVMENKRKDYVLIDSFINENKAFIFNKTDSSYWVLSSSGFDDKHIFNLNKKDKKLLTELFKECN